MNIFPHIQVLNKVSQSLDIGRTLPDTIAMNTKPRCYACSRPLGKKPHLVRCEDEQAVYIGSECFKYVQAGGVEGWNPGPDKRGQVGPTLYLLDTAGLPMYPMIQRAIDENRT